MDERRQAMSGKAPSMTMRTELFVVTDRQSDVGGPTIVARRMPTIRGRAQRQALGCVTHFDLQSYWGTSPNGWTWRTSMVSALAPWSVGERSALVGGSITAF